MGTSAVLIDLKFILPDFSKLVLLRDILDGHLPLPHLNRTLTGLVLNALDLESEFLRLFFGISRNMVLAQSALGLVAQRGGQVRHINLRLRS